MAFDHVPGFAGVHPELTSAEADYALVEELHNDEGLVNAYDAAVIHRREDGKVGEAAEEAAPGRRRCPRARRQRGQRPVTSPGHSVRR